MEEAKDAQPLPLSGGRGWGHKDKRGLKGGGEVCVVGNPLLLHEGRAQPVLRPRKALVT